MAELPAIAGRVVVVGDVMRDVNVRLQGPIVHGSDQRAEIEVLPGGAGANQAAWLAFLGVEVTLFARVGAADVKPLGAELAAQGITPWLAGDARQQTGQLISLVETDGERSFLTDRGANLCLSIADLPPDWTEGTGLVVISGYTFFEPGPREVALEMKAQAQAKSIPVIVDAASIGFLQAVGTEPFLEWTKGVTVLFANREEAALLSDQAFLGKQAEALAGLARMTVIKLGGEGAVAVSGGAIVAQEATHRLDAVDTTGAGDAFLAGFVTAWGKKAALTTTLKVANEVGAKAVMIAGGRPPQ